MGRRKHWHSLLMGTCTGEMARRARLRTVGLQPALLPTMKMPIGCQSVESGCLCPVSRASPPVTVRVSSCDGHLALSPCQFYFLPGAARGSLGSEAGNTRPQIPMSTFQATGGLRQWSPPGRTGHTCPHSTDMQ